MLTDALEYDLPEDRIAQHPLPARDGARLLDLRAGRCAHRRIAELASLLEPSLLVLNDTRVIPARLIGKKPTGGRVELLLIERLGAPGPIERWRCLGRAKGGLRPGLRASFAEGAIEAEVIERLERGEALVRLSARDAITLEDALELHGQLPLPPYVRRAPEVADRERYQTVFAAHPGAIAAPTAGLHLSATSLQALEAAGHRVATITLHVGPGTFRPVEAERLDAHPMHSERYEIPERTVHALAAARAEGRKILAVGTTVVRALEAAAAAPGGLQAGAARTALLIHPPYRFRVVDHLLTNFHLPRSTLLALVMAIGGIENIRAAYAEAIEAGYRFFSYGDAMLIRPESISASAPAIEAP